MAIIPMGINSQRVKLISTVSCKLIMVIGYYVTQ